MLASAGSRTDRILKSISRAFCQVLGPSTPPVRARLFRPADRPRRTGRSTDPPRPRSEAPDGESQRYNEQPSVRC